MKPSERLEVIHRRLLQIFAREGDPLWPTDGTLSKSTALTDVRAEWSMHYVATLETLQAAYSEISQWLRSRSESDEWTVRLAELPICYLERASLVFEESRAEVYLELLTTIAESGAKLVGLDLTVKLFELIEMIKKIKSLSNVKETKAIASDEFLFVAEESMSRMLLAALQVETQAGALTGRFVNSDKSQSALIESWKAPIVGRIRSLRLELSEKSNATISFPEEGFWPAGIRRTAQPTGQSAA